jgi:hypothetical protein
MIQVLTGEPDSRLAIRHIALRGGGVGQGNKDSGEEDQLYC